MPRPGHVPGLVRGSPECTGPSGHGPAWKQPSTARHPRHGLQKSGWQGSGGGIPTKQDAADKSLSGPMQRGVGAGGSQGEMKASRLWRPGDTPVAPAGFWEQKPKLPPRRTFSLAKEDTTGVVI